MLLHHRETNVTVGGPEPDLPDVPQETYINSTPRGPMTPDIHPLASLLRDLIEDPRVTGDFLFDDPEICRTFLDTVRIVRARVNEESPPEATQNDARFLLDWFRQRTGTAPKDATPQQVPPPQHPVLDEAAQAEAMRRSIEAARTYRIANAYGPPSDVAFMSDVLRGQE